MKFIPNAGLLLSLLATTAFFYSGSGAQTSPLTTLIDRAKGQHPASEMPVLCVNGHAATATAAQTITLLQVLGVKCVRIDWNWDAIEHKQQGRYDWNGNTLTDPSGPVSFSSYFSEICGAGIQPILLATYNNPLYAAAPFTLISTPINVTGFNNFGVALATQAAALKCPNPIIEAFNEPNLTIWTNGEQWTGAAYAPVLAEFSSAVKANFPGTKVFSGGVSPGPGIMPAPWIKQMVDAGKTFSDVDAFAIHPYNYHQPAERIPTPAPDQLLLDLKSFKAASGDSKPIAVTEYGFPRQSVGSDLRRQGIYVGWAVLDAIIAGVTHFTVYDLVDDGLDYESNGEHSYGLFFSLKASPGHPVEGAAPHAIKPAGTAFQTVASAMASATSFRVTRDNAASAVTIAFEKPEGITFAIWTTETASQKPYSATVGKFSSLTCKDLLGNTAPCRYTDGKLSASLSATIGPIIATALR